MKKKLIISIMLLLLATSLLQLPAINAHTESEPYVTDLIAGQHMDAGDVFVWNDGENLYVKFLADDGWLISETHLHVATSSSDIPQKNGNPIPGKFEYNKEHDPWVSTYTYIIPLSEWDGGQDLYIAAHAAVMNVNRYCIDFESYNEYDTISTVNTPAGPVGFYMTNYTGFDSLSIGDWVALAPTGDLPTVASPKTITPENGNIVGFTVGSNPFVDDFVANDPFNTGAGGNTLTDTPDYSQTLLQQHAVSMFQAILVDFSSIEDFSGVRFAGVDLDWNEVWNIYYFNSSNILIDIQSIDATPYGQSMDGYAIPINNSNPSITKFVIWGTMNIGTPGRVGFAIDNLCTETAGEETAWGDGEDFPGKNWATYIEYNVQYLLDVELSYNDTAPDAAKPWELLGGNYTHGFNLTLNGDPDDYYYIDVHTITTVEDLADGVYPFNLTGVSDPSAFEAYWDAKGVNPSAITGSWQWYMYNITIGKLPICYLNVTSGATDIMLVDGLLYQIGLGKNPLQVNGEYPEGDYTFEGWIQGINGLREKVTIVITFEQ
jgi:hypothetical protein